MSRLIKCGLLMPSVNLTTAVKAPIVERIAQLKDRPSPRGNSSLILLGVNSDGAVYDGKKLTDGTWFFMELGQTFDTIMVLTRKERSLLYDRLFSLSQRVYVFEELYPSCPIKYLGDAQKNYRALQQWLQKTPGFTLKGEIADYSNKILKKAARKLKFKSSLDSAFAFYPGSPYQESFTISELRDDRRIVCFDFNSMYATAMLGNFSHPKHLAYTRIEQDLSKIKKLQCGIYHAILSEPKDDFIKRFHPFKYVYFSQKYAFSLNENDEIEILLHANEIEYYQKHFKKIFIIDAVNSKQTILHPLRKDVLKLYNDRLNFKKQNNVLLANRCKLQLSSMHSCIRQTHRKKQKFTDFEQIFNFLKSYYGCDFIEFWKNDLNEFTGFLETYAKESGRDFMLKKSRDGAFKLILKNLYSNCNVYCLYSQILAYTKIKMLETLEYILSFVGTEICYCNVDSIHISLPQDKLAQFLDHMAPMIGTELGKLKIESIGNKGFWLQPGKYWILNDEKVVLFKNAGINDPANLNEFKDNHSTFMELLSGRKIFPVALKRHFDSTLSFNKKADFSDPDHAVNLRYSYEEIKNYQRAGASVIEEMQRSKSLKLSLFEKIKTSAEAPV